MHNLHLKYLKNYCFVTIFSFIEFMSGLEEFILPKPVIVVYYYIQ